MTKNEVPQGVAHWSKDFVEHLRTVHFALIAVSVGLIALSLTRPAGTLAKALVQLREIREVAGLDHKGQFSWVDSWSESQVKRAVESVGLKADLPIAGFLGNKGNIKKYYVLCGTGSNEHAFSLYRNWILMLNSLDDPPPAMRSFIAPHLPQQESAIVSAEAFELMSNMTLGRFEQQWDFLDKDLRIAVPYSMESRAFGWDANKSAWTEYPCRAPSPEKWYDYRPLGIGLLVDATRWPILHSTIGNDTSELGFVSSDNSYFIQIDEFRDISFDGQSWFMTRFPHWNHGDFKSTFTELAEFSEDLKSVGLATVERILRAQQSRASDAFEAFGIKMSAEIVTRFGILLVVAVQLYFAMHLSELSVRLKSSDPGWDVPWIGVYENGLARAVYFLTLFLLPVGASVALGVRGLEEFGYDRGSWVALVLGISANLSLASLIWRRSPRARA